MPGVGFKRPSFRIYRNDSSLFRNTGIEGAVEDRPKEPVSCCSCLGAAIDPHFRSALLLKVVLPLLTGFPRVI